MLFARGKTLLEWEGFEGFSVAVDVVVVVVVVVLRALIVVGNFIVPATTAPAMQFHIKLCSCEHAAAMN